MLRRLLPVVSLLGGLLLGATPAWAGAQRPNVIDVVEVSGRIDPVTVDFLRRSIVNAEAGGSEVLVVQLDSPGALVDRDRLNGLADRIRRSRVPVAVWAGPTGARVSGGAVDLLRAAAVAGMAPGTRVAGRGPDAAKAAGLVATVDPTLGEFVVGLDGREVAGRTLQTAKVVPRGELLRRQAAGDVRFGKLGLVERVLHLSARPQVAYLLLVVGLLLLLFEFFTVGVGLAGVSGAGCLVLAAYGLAVLPTNAVALGLVGLGVFGFAVDVQAGAPRAWTGIGTVSLLVGSWRLFPGGLSLSWIVIVPVVAGVLLFMLSGMTAMLRARFSTPTIGRESMIGEMGQATTGIDPEGMVDLRGGTWRARTNRATPIPAGDAVRVVAIDGLLLEVEPETGGARDAGH